MAQTVKSLRTKARGEPFPIARQAGIVGVVRTMIVQGRPYGSIRNLQLNFSLNQTLALYVVETLDLPGPEEVTYPLDMVTLVEAVLEDPSVILFRQIDALERRTHRQAQGRRRPV